MAGAFFFLATCVATTCIIACNGRQASKAARADNSASSPSAYPLAVEFNRVGKYPSETKSGAGYFYDDVLEYRVWFYPEGGGDDRYAAFAQYEQALAFSKATPDAEEPLVLVRQRQWVDEPHPGHYVPKSGERITEWQVQWLSGSKRTTDSIGEFMKHPRPARTSGGPNSRRKSTNIM
jgi:putative acetyltransferase